MKNENQENQVSRFTFGSRDFHKPPLILFRLINRRCLVLTDLFDDKNRD